MTNRTNHELLVNALRRVGTLLRDIAYGIDAGSAIRHGLPVSPRRGSAVAQCGAQGPTPPTRSTE